MVRKFAKMQQEELAESACIPVGQVRAMERGENVGITYIQAVVAVFIARSGEKKKYPKLAPAVEHELFRQMAIDGDEQIALARSNQSAAKRA